MKSEIYDFFDQIKGKFLSKNQKILQIKNLIKNNSEKIGKIKKSLNTLENDFGDLQGLLGNKL